jgi:hypothetical protein
MKKALLICLAFASAAGRSAEMLVEAESFSDLGGWSVDQQFMDQMGSPFLLAHGLGRPVAPAKTTVDVAVRGTYRLWVRTRDWVSPHGPGRFIVKVAGKSSCELGKGPGEWGWRDGGMFELEAGKCPVEIVDLTGFDGRVDAVCFSTEARPKPIVDEFESRKVGFRRQTYADNPKALPKFDLCVVGGGVAGICAAVSAARLGLSVALVHNRPVLGGNNSSEVRVHLGAYQNLPPYPRLGDVLANADGPGVVGRGGIEPDQLVGVIVELLGFGVALGGIPRHVGISRQVVRSGLEAWIHADAGDERNFVALEVVVAHIAIQAERVALQTAHYRSILAKPVATFNAPS